MKTAIIKYDEKRLEDFTPEVEDALLGRAVRLALTGRDYPKGRGIISIEPFVVLPDTREKVGMG